MSQVFIYDHSNNERDEKIITGLYKVILKMVPWEDQDNIKC